MDPGEAHVQAWRRPAEGPLFPRHELCRQSQLFEILRALSGFAVNAGLDFDREGAKDAKQTRRTVCLGVQARAGVNNLLAAVPRHVSSEARGVKKQNDQNRATLA